MEKKIDKTPALGNPDKRETMVSVPWTDHVHPKKLLAIRLQANRQDPHDLYRIALAYRMKGDKTKAKEFCAKAAHYNGLPLLNYAFVKIRAEKMLADL